MRLTPSLWLRSPLLALRCCILQLQILLPRFLRRVGKKHTSRHYTVITAVYNAERWLPTYFASLFGQTLDAELCLEIICVDDGSTDSSAARIRHWQELYPNTITYLCKENGGAASARNMGLEAATGEWVTFMDADDFVHPDYFAAVDAFLDEPAPAPLGMIACNCLAYIQDTGSYHNSHPLRQQFVRGSQRVPAAATDDFVQVMTNSAFFSHRVLMETGIRQREDVRPTFEDGEMVIRYVLAIADKARAMDIGVLPGAKYFHTQHPTPASLTGRAHRDAAYFDTPLALGRLRLLREVKEHHGTIPRFAQMTILYSLSRYFQRIVGESTFAGLDKAVQTRFFDLVRDILGFIEPALIERARFTGTPPFFNAFMLTLLGGLPCLRQAFIERLHVRDRTLRLSLYGGSPKEEFRFLYDGQPIMPSYTKATKLPTWGQTALYEHTLLLPLPHEHGVLSVADMDVAFFCADDGTGLGAQPSLHAIKRALAVAGLPELSWHQALRLRLARLPMLRKRYGRAWLFTDRDTRADDNAEHLYRHVLHHHPEQPAFFALRKNSPDWRRLRAEGFRLVRFGSWRHLVILLNCERLIASQGDKGITRTLPHSLCRHQLVFLGHGVIRGNISSNMNRLPITLRPMTTPAERDYISGDGSPFRLTAKETPLTGMARFDALFRARKTEPERRILFMPSWRRDLTGPAKAGSNARTLKEGFADSLFAKSIYNVIYSERLAGMLARYGYTLVFSPHNHMLPYFQGQQFPDRVHFETPGCSRTTQDMFIRSRVVITDYSSIAFDAAFLGRALIYYQFDRHTRHGGDHYEPGFLNYERDGFGPVTHSLNEMLDALEDILHNDSRRTRIYAERAEAAFFFHDAESCERIFKAMAEL